MKKIAVLTDSGSGISQIESKELGIFVLPLLVVVEGKTYLDGIEIQLNELYTLLSEKKHPKTSTPLYQSIENMLIKIKNLGYTDVIALPLSSGLSSTYQSIALASQEVNLNHHLIEIYSTCMIQNHCAKLAQKLVNENKQLDEIISELNRVISLSNTIILPNDLEYLKQGGRLTPLAASLASMFKIRPVLQLNQSVSGKIDVLSKVRTERKALETAIDTLDSTFSGKSVSIYIIHSAADERCELTKQLLIGKGYSESSIQIHAIAAVIASHTGLDCLGIQFIIN
ncbi:MAG TPA: DegV family protein [Erysipelotrichaceae bacterium]|nr:DegV family protein [Erysipelotrichaceae bacterium]